MRRTLTSRLPDDTAQRPRRPARRDLPADKRTNAPRVVKILNYKT